MAEAFVRFNAAEGIEAYSAGSHPSGRVNPIVTEAMREVGYDMSKHWSKSLADIPAGKYEYVITMGCGDECPFIPAIHHEDWQIPNPKGLPIEEIRRIRDQICKRVMQLTESIRQADARGY